MTKVYTPKLPLMKYILNHLFLTLTIIAIFFIGCTKNKEKGKSEDSIGNVISVNIEENGLDNSVEIAKLEVNEDNGCDEDMDHAISATTISVPYQSQYEDNESFDYSRFEIPEDHILNRLMQHVTSKSSTEWNKGDSKFYYIKFFYIGMTRYCMIKESSLFDIEKYDGYAYIDNKLCFIISRNYINLDVDNTSKLMIKIDRGDTIHDGIYDPWYYIYKFDQGKIHYIEYGKENIYWAKN